MNEVEVTITMLFGEHQVKLVRNPGTPPWVVAGTTIALTDDQAAAAAALGNGGEQS